VVDPRISLPLLFYRILDAAGAPFCLSTLRFPPLSFPPPKIRNPSLPFPWFLSPFIRSIGTVCRPHTFVFNWFPLSSLYSPFLFFPPPSKRNCYLARKLPSPLSFTDEQGRSSITLRARQFVASSLLLFTLPLLPETGPSSFLFPRPLCPDESLVRGDLLVQSVPFRFQFFLSRRSIFSLLQILHNKLLLTPEIFFSLPFSLARKCVVPRILRFLLPPIFSKEFSVPYFSLRVDLGSGRAAAFYLCTPGPSSFYPIFSTSFPSSVPSSAARGADT